MKVLDSVEGWAVSGRVKRFARGLVLSVGLSVVVVGGGARAATTSSRVAICPWQVTYPARSAANVLRDSARSEASTRLNEVPEEEVRAAISEEGCEGSMESLAPLAARAKAAYALHVVAVEAKNRLVLKWTLVARGGRSLDPSRPLTSTFSTPVGGASEVAREHALQAAVGRFYTQAVAPRIKPLEIVEEALMDDAPISPIQPPGTQSVATTRAVSAGSPGTDAAGNVTPTGIGLDARKSGPMTRPPSLMRSVGMGAAGAGVAALVTSGVLYATSSGDRRALEGMLGPNGELPNTPEALELSRSLDSRGRWVNGTLIGGAALVVTGAAMYWLAPKTTSPVVASVGASPNGGGLLVRGNF